MIIQISERLLKKEINNDFYLANSFHQVNDGLIYIADFIHPSQLKHVKNIEYYTAIKLTQKENGFDIAPNPFVLKIDSSNEKLLEILAVDKCFDHLEARSVWAETFDALFLMLRNENNKVDVKYSEDILNLIFRVLNDFPKLVSITENDFPKLASITDYDAVISIDIFDGFELKTTLSKGVYEGNIMLTNWRLIDSCSELVIAKLPDVQLNEQFFIEDGDDEQWMLSSLAEAIPYEDTIKYAIEAIIKSKILFCEKYFSVYDDYKKFNGMTFEVIGMVDRSTYDYDEVGEKYIIQLSNGVELEALPEEIVKEVRAENNFPV